jgi:hypothetical protein
MPLIAFLAAFLLLAQAAAPTPSSQNASPGKPVVEPTPDPASVHFLSDAGLLLVAIKPTAVADYEEVIRALQEALAKDADKTRATAAKGWRVYKATGERREG